MLAELDAGRRRVVECGSGLSTIVIARRLRELGGGSVHSLEHDPAWAAEGRSRLAGEGLGDLAEVIEAPLAPHPAAAPGCLWYDRAALAALPAAGVELLLVDGPPAGEPEIERSRYPALPSSRPASRPAPRCSSTTPAGPASAGCSSAGSPRVASRRSRLDESGLAIVCMLRAVSDDTDRRPREGRWTG